MKRQLSTMIAASVLLGFSAGAARIINYNGQLYESGVAVSGQRVFYFELLTNGVAAWQSGSFVTQTVEYGYFTARLGDPAQMTPLPECLFSEGPDIYLRVWAGTSPSATNLLSPDTRLLNTAYSIDADKLSGLPAARYQRLWTNVVIVAPGGRDGGGDFNNLNTAILSANARATALNPYTVLILPGTYAGPLPAIPAPHVHVVGLDRDNCIITGTIRLNQNTLVENVTITVTSGHGIHVVGGAPTIHNVKIVGGANGIYAQTGTGATIVDVEAYDGTGPALYDQIGCVVDGLRVTNRMAFVITQASTTGIYKNVRHQATSSGFGDINHGASALLRSLQGTGTLTVNEGGWARLRDVRIACMATCIDIIQIHDGFELYDGDLESSANYPFYVRINGVAAPIRCDDVRFSSAEQHAVNLQLASVVTLKECDIYVAGLGNGINCGVLSDLYVQGCRIRCLNFGIANAPANTWVYDTTIRSSMASIQGVAGAPRIADSRLNTDTQPIQATPWNAFGNPGPGGPPEDLNGNIVAPGAGAPVTP